MRISCTTPTKEKQQVLALARDSTATGTFGAQVAEKLRKHYEEQALAHRASAQEQKLAVARVLINRMRMGKVGSEIIRNIHHGEYMYSTRISTI